MHSNQPADLKRRAGSHLCPSMRLAFVTISRGGIEYGMVVVVRLRSVEHGAIYPAQVNGVLDDDGGLLEVELDDSRDDSVQTLMRRSEASITHCGPGSGVSRADARFSGRRIVSRPEGNTNLYHDRRLDDLAASKSGSSTRARIRQVRSRIGA